MDKICPWVSLAVVLLEIPTGNPLLIELNDALTPTAARYLDTERARDLPELP